jgi:hypothetical protein
MFANGTLVPLTLIVVAPLETEMLFTGPLIGFPEASVPVTTLPSRLEADAMLCSKATEPSVVLRLSFVTMFSI